MEIEERPFNKHLERNKAIWMATLTLLVYAICYFSRNILGTVQPEMAATTDFSVEMLGTVASVGMFSYAIGQLVCGVIGDYVKAKYMLSGGLLLSAVATMILPFADSYALLLVAYGAMSLFLSAIFGPITKTISQFTAPAYVNRVALMTSVASIISSPMAGVMAMFFDWRTAFIIAAAFQLLIAVFNFVFFTVCEKKGWITYPERVKKDKSARKGMDWKLLIKHAILQYIVVAALTGVKNSIVYWIPTYFVQHLGYSTTVAAAIFTVVTVIKSVSPFFTNFVLYERLFKRRSNGILVLSFGASAVCYFVMSLTNAPVISILLVSIALFIGGAYSTLLFSVYCPGLKKTGAVSGVSGFLNCINYLVGALANFIISKIVTDTGWSPILIGWTVLMLVGAAVSLPILHKNSEVK